MATTVSRRRRPVDVVDPASDFRQRMVLVHEAAPLIARADKLKARLKKWFAESPSGDVYTNENGSQFFDLEDPFQIGDTVYTGMEHRRSVTPQFVEEEAEKILKRKGLLEEATSTYTYIDQDKISRLQQEGKITEKEIDKMFEDKETWAFWPVKES